MSRKIKKGKIVYITENQLNMISEAKIIENVVSKFSLDYRLVKLIMDYLNKGFKKGFIEQIGDDGFPQQIPIVTMVSSTGEALKNLSDKQLFYLLQDRFQDIFSDKKKVSAVLKQIIVDWYYNKIKNGLLSKNLIE